MPVFISVLQRLASGSSRGSEELSATDNASSEAVAASLADALVACSSLLAQALKNAVSVNAETVVTIMFITLLSVKWGHSFVAAL